MIINKNWLDTNLNYWEEVSNVYDFLYNTTWSKLENLFVKKKLNELLKEKQGIVLDLGFGLGLGFEFIRENQQLRYCGIDISKGMLDKCSKKFPNLNLSTGCMSDLSAYENEQFDAVMSIFTSFSYTDNVTQTLEEIKRVLKPNGVIFISVLGRFSLRRLIKSLFKRVEKFRTRRSKLTQYSNSWTFTVKELIFIFEVAGFEDIKVFGLNSFSGVFEIPLLWNLGLQISNFLPNLSHELIITAKFNPNE